MQRLASSCGCPWTPCPNGEPHAAGWQRLHLDWEFKLAEQGSEPDQTLVDGIINATESFLRSSEVHRLFIQAGAGHI